MIMFTEYNKAFAIGVCIMVGISISSVMYVSRVDSLCPTYFGNSTVLCYAAIGGLATGISGVSWPILPTGARALLALSSTVLMDPGFQVSVAILTYGELLPVWTHIQRVLNVALDTADCLKEETAYSLQEVRRAIFKESHVKHMTTGIQEVVSTFGVVKTRQERYREQIENGFRWLETKGLSCKQALIIPFQKCINDFIEWEKSCWDSQKKEFKSWKCRFEDIGQKIKREVCYILEPLGRAACGVFSEERITNWLLSIRMKFDNFINNAIRMRIGVKFELSSTGHVEDELASAWAPLKQLFTGGANFSSWLYVFVKNILLRYLSWIVIASKPIWIYLCFLIGPLMFDNRYIPADEEERQNRRLGPDAPDEIRLLPLPYGAESERLQVIYDYVMMPDEIAKLIKSLIWMFDFAVVVGILLIDFHLTSVFDQMYVGTINLFNRYQGNIFDISYERDVKGFRWIRQVIVQQLDQMQHAAGLGRMIACARRPPPINYNYNIFIMAFLFRFFFLFSRAKLAWIPTMICARFYPNRHRLRMRALKAHTLLHRDGHETPHMFPWLRAFFRTFCNCAEIDAAPHIFQSCFSFRDTFNL